jgi:hypothetical protein
VSGDTQAKREGLDGWCVLELMGHRRLAGRVQEVTVAGQGFLRIDIPAVKGREPVTQLYSPGSVYAITPTTEELAKAVAESISHEPVYEAGFRKPALPSAGREVDTCEHGVAQDEHCDACGDDDLDDEDDEP